MCSSATNQDFRRVVRMGTGPSGEVWVTIVYKDGRLSLVGVEGPTDSGNARGSCGQCTDALRRLYRTREGIDAAKLADIWDKWHLNDMRAGCEHQRAEGWGGEDLEVVTYKLTSEAYQHRKDAEERAVQAAAAGKVADLSPTARALLACKWWAPISSPPDADSPLSGCYEVEKRETKKSGWVYPHEHERGQLTKPCPVCGYEYGSEWRREEVPADVVEWLQTLPNDPGHPWRGEYRDCD
jgi:hypothetical protein